ncbi:putative sterigmatocystin biosynthesis P450 monooxygenase stcF [Colletotrichum spaethianum]|uniref:Sterigmatocystin biosynthesis P450 monooxygenase stcF n=1 Tax=Colletotrichum spaethianum TaxID=700344 RepID=A0AA37PH42_9PEZI|nr:putative sterigmatocystin biosynthesis P450 monooxygenase stcF [Colletotrichum spaethianum]GKT52221.1 putative sterigmatocystin biosynthesis P450 monooxygenase stcF [Colletotrichum spaethianum]
MQAMGYGLLAILTVFVARHAALLQISWLMLSKIILTGVTCSIGHLPGPWYTRFSHYALKLYTLTGRRMHYVHTLHHKYGPVVRISPTEVAVADPEGSAAIHKIGAGFLKGPWYSTLNPKVEPGIFSMIDPKQHAARRKLFARAFTSASLRQNWESIVRQKVERAVERIKTDALNGKADVLKWWTLMTTDVIAHLSFGESFQMLELGEVPPFDGMTLTRPLESVFVMSTIQNELPLLYHLARFLPVKSIQSVLGAQKVVDSHAGRAAANLRQNGHSANLFGNMLAESEAGEKSDLTEDKVQAEAGNFIIAGSDTTSVSLTYLVWAVLKRPGLQIRLEEELAGIPDDFDDASLERLPLLNAVIDETLRLYGAAPGNLPRSVPPNGATLGGYFIPGGTVVETQAYTLHRHPDVYHDPLRFDETRFLNQDSLSKQQKQLFSPFGAGTRICIGLHLARMELRLATATFFRKCRGVKLADNMTDDMMEMQNFFLISPAGHHCDVTLRS